MTTRSPDPIRQVAQALARARDPADVVAALAAATTGAFGAGCTIDLTAEGIPRVPFVAHARRELIETMRAARGDDAIEESDLAMAAQRRTLTTSLGRHSDPIERVRLALRAEVVAVLPLAAGDETLGYLAIYGRRLSEESLRLAELLALTAGISIDRLIVRLAYRAEISVRDASIAMLASLSEHSPIPAAFIDEELRVVVANDAFARAVRATHDDLFRAPLDALNVADRAGILRVVREVMATRTAVVRDVGSILLAAHPVTGHAAIGISLIDVSAQRRAARAARALADAGVVLSGARDVQHARRSVVDLARQFPGDAAMLISDDGTITSDVDIGPLIEALPPELGPKQVCATRVPLAITADDLAILALGRESLRDALGDVRAILIAPLGQHVLALVRRGDDYSAEERAFAADLARLAQRAFDSAAARDEVRSWAVLFSDFLGMVSRDLRDPITALVARIYAAQHSRDAVQALPALRKQAERLRDVAQRLLEVAPRVPRDVSDEIDLGGLVREEAAGAIAIAAARGARILIDDHQARAVQGNRRRLGEALRDVFAHAASETPNEGIFCIRVDARSHEIAISVSHNGAGLAREDARRVFDALWDGRAEGRALTIARAVFAAHGGRSWIETAEGHGTAYCFALPLDESARTVA